MFGMKYPTEDLLDEVRLLWHVMNRSAARLHRHESVTLGMRGVLELVLRQGPATVPHVARSRHVTRQHIQGLVNALLKLKLVELGTNPAHRRSPLVQLTPAGRKTIDRMKQREDRLLSRIDSGRDPKKFRRAADVLRGVRRALEETE